MYNVTAIDRLFIDFLAQLSLVRLANVSRPHHSKNYMRLIGTYVHLSVGHVYKPCKNGRTDRDAVWGLTCVGQKNHVLDGFDIPTGRSNFRGCPPIVKHWDSILRCTQQKGSFNPNDSSACDATFCQYSLTTCLW